MSLRNWLRSWLATQPPTCRSQRSRLTLTRLENRDVPATIQGTAFNDVNGNGQFDGEGGIAGVVVYLDMNQNAILDIGDVATTTDANGAYSFAGVASPGAWVQEILPVGDTTGRWVGTTRSRVPQSVSANPEGTFTIDFGQQFHAFGGYTPIGGQVQVSTTPTGVPATAGLDDRHTSSVASSAAAGRFVSVWREYHPGGADRILARVSAADGSPLTGEVVVDAAAGNSANVYSDPVVAMTGDGRFAVAWNSLNPATGNSVVYTRAFAADGTPAAARVRVTPDTTTDRNVASGIGMDGSGNFTVLYSGSKTSKNGSSDGGIIGFQRYNAAGAAVGGPTQVVNATLINGNASLAMAPSGQFVVTWDDSTSRNGSTVNAQRYNANGTKAGGAIVVASGGSIVTWQSSVTMDATGRFVVTWVDRPTSGPNQHAQVFNANGTRSGSVVHLGTGSDEAIAATFDSAGNLIFAWTDTQGETRLRRLTAAGVEPDYVVNTTTDGTQGRPSVAMLADGRFVVGWMGNGPDGSSGAFFQLYGPTV